LRPKHRRIRQPQRSSPLGGGARSASGEAAWAQKPIQTLVGLANSRVGPAAAQLADYLARRATELGAERRIPEVCSLLALEDRKELRVATNAAVAALIAIGPDAKPDVLAQCTTPQARSRAAYYLRSIGDDYAADRLLGKHLPASVRNATVVRSTTPARVVERASTPAIGIAGFVLSIVGASIIGLILSWVGYAQAKREGQSSGLCLAGIIIGGVGLAATIIVLIVILAAASAASNYSGR
jgi:hypothetical protein